MFVLLIFYSRGTSGINIDYPFPQATPNGSSTPTQTGTPNTDAAGAKDVVKIALDLLKESSKGEDEVPNVPKEDVNEDISGKAKVEHHRVDANGDKNKDKEREKERSKTRDRERGRDSDRERDREKEMERDRDKLRERSHHRSKDKGKDSGNVQN